MTFSVSSGWVTRTRSKAASVSGRRKALRPKPLMKVERASVFALSGDVERAQSELKELQEISKQRYISAYHIATIYAALKDRDRAFEWLEKAFQERADWMVFLNVDPRFKSLHSDSRFADLLRRMNLD